MLKWPVKHCINSIPADVRKEKNIGTKDKEEKGKPEKSGKRHQTNRQLCNCEVILWIANYTVWLERYVFVPDVSVLVTVNITFSLIHFISQKNVPFHCQLTFEFSRKLVSNGNEVMNNTKKWNTMFQCDTLPIRFPLERIEKSHHGAFLSIFFNVHSYFRLFCRKVNGKLFASFVSC